jgi:hypothetical protein
MDGTDGQDMAQLIENQIGTAYIEDSYDEKSPDEILITGKTDVAGSEKAKLTYSANNGVVLTVLNYSVRLENIEISEISGKSCLAVVRGKLTLAKGVKISNNNAEGIFAHRAIVIMCDDAEVSNNAYHDNTGVYLENGSVLVMQDNTVVTGNKAQNNGGGVALSSSSLYMLDNAKISKNSAGKGGGGIVTFTDAENGYISQIIMHDSAIITENSADGGGGILLQDILKMDGNSQITGNTATDTGGGVLAMTANMSVSIYNPEKALFGNKAPKAPDTNLNFK